MRHEIYLNSIREEQDARVMENKDVIRLLADSSRSAADIIAEQKGKRGPRFELPEIVLDHEDGDAADDDEEDAAYDLIMEDFANEDGELVQDYYLDPWTEDIRKDLARRGGGWSAKLVYERAIQCAFKGVF